jgi:ABC-type sugar transport system substrate-binding protein
MALDHRKRAGLVAALATVLVLPLACSTGQQAEGTKNQKQSGTVQVGVVMYARDLEYWRLIEAGVRKAAADRHVQIDVQVSNRQLDTEAALVDTMHARGDNVLVIDPLDKKASVATLNKAQRYGMTVVQYDGQVQDPSFQYHVGVDNTTLGRAVGDSAQNYIKAHLGGHARLALLTGDTEPNGPARRTAFLGQVADSTVVAQAEAVGSPEAGSKALETMLQGHPDIDLVFAWNGASMQGAAVAAQRAKSTAKIVGIDMSKQVATIMSQPDSPVVDVADQHAYDVGQQAVATAVDLAEGKPVQQNTLLNPVVYSSDDPKGVEAFLAELQKAAP